MASSLSNSQSNSIAAREGSKNGSSGVSNAARLVHRLGCTARQCLFKLKLRSHHSSTCFASWRHYIQPRFCISMWSRYVTLSIMPGELIQRYCRNCDMNILTTSGVEFSSQIVRQSKPSSFVSRVTTWLSKLWRLKHLRMLLTAGCSIFAWEHSTWLLNMISVLWGFDQMHTDLTAGHEVKPASQANASTIIEYQVKELEMMNAIKEENLKCKQMLSPKIEWDQIQQYLTTCVETLVSLQLNVYETVKCLTYRLETEAEH